MYGIFTNSRQIEKKFKQIEEYTTDEKGYCRIRDALINSPKGNETTHKEISKKGKCWNFDLTYGDRVTYKVYDNKTGKRLRELSLLNNFQTLLMCTIFCLELSEAKFTIHELGISDEFPCSEIVQGLTKASKRF